MAETRGSSFPINPCVISDKNSDLGLLEESKNSDLGLSEESNESSSADVSTDAVVSSAAVTEEMFKIEQQLEEETIAEEQKLYEKALEDETERKENCYKRLQHLLNRSSIYAKFLVRQMEKQEARSKKAMQKSQNRQNLKEEQPARNLTGESCNKQNGDQSDTEMSRRNGKKRSFNSSKSSKRAKQEVQLSEIFDKGDVTEQANKQNKSEDVSEKSAAVPDTYSRTINGERVSDLQPNLVTGGVMRDYQIAALEWLKVLYENGVNGILGDEMGLGKTIECIALIAHLVEMGVSGPYLIACPLSTLLNWVNEFKRFTPEIPVILYHGSMEERAVLRRKIYRKVLVRNKPIYPVVVTSYSIVMRDRTHLMPYQWVIIVDEGHRIKNWQCQLISQLKKYRSTNRLLLTGTPLQNNLAELWSLLNFLLPEIFDDLQVFESWFDVTTMTHQSSNDEIVAQEQEKQIVSTIHQILAPFLLRRTKADVNLKLPPKKELIVYAPMSQKQKELYTAVANKTIQNLLGEKENPEVSGKRNRGNTDLSVYFDERADIEEYVKALSDQRNKTATESSRPSSTSVIHVTSNTMLVMMRKICNHPYLVEFPLDPSTNDYLINEDMVKVCGKLQILDLMLPELKRRGHKVLIFTQFVTMLDILDFYCEMRGYSCYSLHGQIPVEERQKSIDDFNANPSSFIFLISTRAGGLGINLTAADTVIIYDSDWNPQNDLQAQDRCHRFGQTKPVVVYRLVTANSAEQQIIERACAKRKLEKMIIRKGQFSSSEHIKESKMMTPGELLEILHETDFSGTLNVEDVISPENLNALLDRSDMLQSPENGSLHNGKKESRNPTEVKGVFKVVKPVDSCDFGRKDNS